MCMCVSQLGKLSAEQSPKTATPKAPPSAPPPSAPVPSDSFGNLRGPSDFPLSLHARVTPVTPQQGLGAASRTAGFEDNEKGDPSPQLGLGGALQSTSHPS